MIVSTLKTTFDYFPYLLIYLMLDFVLYFVYFDWDILVGLFYYVPDEHFWYLFGNTAC